MNDQSTDNAPHAALSRSGLRRLICALALVPIVPATALIAVSWCHEPIQGLINGSPWLSGIFKVDEVRLFNGFVAVFTVLVSIVIWRSLILWTLGRKWLTALVSMIPFVQVFIAQPLWNAGCGGREFLRLAQEQVGVGVWVWVMVWVWWGWERFGVTARAFVPPSRSLHMMSNLQRGVASIGVIPFTFGVWLIAGEALDDLFGFVQWSQIAAAYAIAALAAVLAWVLVWRKRVLWNGLVIYHTALGTLVLIAFPIALAACAPELSEPLDTTVLMLPVIGWGFWMIGTMWRWPLRLDDAETPDGGPTCLKCGYLLKGLTRTRCPECGAEPTLDELWSAAH